jgi:hypothetical protein
LFDILSDVLLAQVGALRILLLHRVVNAAPHGWFDKEAAGPKMLFPAKRNELYSVTECGK